MPALRLLFRRQIGINIGATKAVDRLLRIPNQQQTTIGCRLFGLINPAENTPLQWVGILKLIDQRQWKLAA